MKKKNSAKEKIIEYIMHYGSTSKVELAKELHMSMPTILNNVNELLEKGMLSEVGEYQSTGGRKAKSIGLQKDYCYSMGLNITRNHIGLVLINFTGEIVEQLRKRMKFAASIGYFQILAEEVRMFLEANTSYAPVLGLGISFPGILNKELKILVKSHALELDNYSLGIMEDMMPLPVFFENDANAAMLAENLSENHNTVYLSLSNTVGGAMYLDGQLFEGDNRRAGEFGHMILVPSGAKCYCGKKGCADAYVSVRALMEGVEDNLEAFMERLDTGEQQAVSKWETYLDYLAIFISNLRMAYDTDIILGGDIGGILVKYKMQLSEKLLQYNLFDGDLSYLKYCTYNKEASAVGVAKYFFGKLMQEV